MITWNIASFIGAVIALYTSHKMWGVTGMWFTLGLLMQSWKIELAFRRRTP